MQRRIWLHLFDHQAPNEHRWLFVGAKSCREKRSVKVAFATGQSVQDQAAVQAMYERRASAGDDVLTALDVELRVEESVMSTPMISVRYNTNIPIPIHPTRDLVNF